MENKKPSLIYILQILRDYSDENHPIKQVNIQEKLLSIYNLELERKALTRNLKLLIDLGYDVNKCKGGYYLLSRTFDKTEVSFLVDAVFSSKIVNDNQAKELARKITSFLSVHERHSYEYLFKSEQVNRSASNELFLNVELINEAIEKNKQIRFQYQYYKEDKTLDVRRKDVFFRISPYYLINNFGKYYVLSNYDRYDDTTIYRVELMTNVQIIDTERKPISQIPVLGDGFDVAKYINDHVYLFGGKVVTAKIRITDDKAISYIVDWFGNNAKIALEGNEKFAYVKCDEIALFYWLLQYCQYTEVVEPLTLRNKLAATMKEQYEKYSK